MKKKIQKRKKNEVEKISERIIAVKRTLEQFGRELGIAIPKSLPIIVASVIQKIAEAENTTFEYILSEIQIVKPVPSSQDPIIIYRGWVLVWWL